MRLRVAVKTKAGSSAQSYVLNLARPVALGRGPESLVSFDGDEVSREHVSFAISHGRLVVTDLSSNGSWLNRFRLNPNQPYLVNPGDLVEVPGYEIAVVELEDDAPAGASSGFAKKLPFTLSGTEKILLAATLAVIGFFILYLRS